MKIEYIIIKPEDDFCNSIESINNLLRSNSKIVISNDSLTFDKIVTINVLFTKLVCEQKERIFRVILLNEDKDPEKCIKALEKAAHIFCKTLKEYGKDFKINIIWDEVSQHYCKLSYPLLNKIENQMRNLIFRFMIENLGSDWVEKAIPQDVRKSLKQNADRSKIASSIENCLYEADFIHLIQFLFKPYTTVSSIKELFDKLDKVGSIEELNELRALKPLSNWDRYFSSLIKFDKLEEKWTDLYFLRNKIAHNKLLIRADYEKLFELSTEISKCLEKTLSELDKIKIPEVAKDAIRKIAFHSIESGFANIPQNLLGISGYSGIFNMGDRASVFGLSVDSPYLSNTKVSLSGLPSGYKSILGVETDIGAYSLAPIKICSKCCKSFISSPISLNISDKCPECEQIDLLNSINK